jgi:hypothetical protein
MNIGEMQRKLSYWAEQDAERQFYGLYKLISRSDWLLASQCKHPRKSEDTLQTLPQRED